MGGLAGLLGFDAADRLGGDPADGPGVLAAEVDGDGLGGDVDGDDLAAEAEASHTMAVGLVDALHRAESSHLLAEPLPGFG